MAKEILLFSRDDCGYCAKAHKAIAELKAENPAYGTLSLREVEETREPEFIEKFDYYAVPTLYLDGVKKFEAHIGMGYDEIKDAVKRVFDEALG
ncbi:MULTISPECIES: glutaredoxin family protein [Stomatobaculum]|jgi:glutaredoxin|uniref:glutaredoxin family protein n=1 Tax=Stomatobaculum TaxID=1213720 RepID=UPI00272D03A2|nr:MULTISPECIES: glutaredoxin family protein [Stomatobaculum]WLD86776.1 glutaredoxin family protein [Stomatobaculum sp. F0698]